MSRRRPAQRTGRRPSGRAAQVPMPWAASPASQTDVVARPGPSKVVFLPRWTPKFVWTLHTVPGRLDGPPLAVRRRCLEQFDCGLDFELARRSIGMVYTKDLEREGSADGRLRAGDYGIDVGLMVYDHRPTEAEREEFMRRRRIERGLRLRVPRKVWLATPAMRIGQPHLTLSFPCSLASERGVIGESRFECDVRTPSWRNPKLRPGEGYVIDWPQFDLLALMTKGPQRAYWRYWDMNVVIYLERPSDEELDRLGRERAEQEAQNARHKRESEDFFAGFRVNVVDLDPAARKRKEGLAALAALGLNESASAADVQRAFRAKAKTEHPDKGGAGDMAELVRLRDRALSAVKGAVA